MSCFWIGLLNGIKIDDYSIIKYNNIGLKPHPAEFVQLLKNINVITPNILWNDEELIRNQLDENFQAINQLDINSINNGYLCSTFEPFLFLICELLQITIIHNYINNKIIYKHKTNNRYILKFKSSDSHFEIDN